MGVRMKLLISSFALAILFSAQAQVGLPLQVDANTLALWNFDTNTDTTVVDLASSPMDGTIFGATREPMPDLDTAYLLSCSKCSYTLF